MADHGMLPASVVEALDSAFRMDDAERRDLKEIIAAYGHMMFAGCGCLRADGLVVSYTCGLTDRGLPEIMVSALPPAWAHVLVTQLISVLPPIGPTDDRIEFTDLDFPPAMLRRVPREPASRQILMKCVGYYGRDVDVMQLVLTDKRGFYPWEKGVETSFVETQSPLIDWSKDQ